MNEIRDFTLAHYKAILQIAQEKFVVQPVAAERRAEERILILRHDIDISPEAAYKIACLENEMGVKSTYYILLHSPFYNALDVENLRFFKEIQIRGHEVGLHFDSHFFGTTNEEELEKQLIIEKQLLEAYLNIEVKSFSFHLTNEFTKSCNKKYYAGLINAFPAFFQNDQVYCSDSYGVWRFKRLYDYLLKTKEPLIQILTHPEWWIFEPITAEQRIQKHIEIIEQKLWREANKNYILKSL